MAQKIPLVLQMNCGYARGAIFELSKGQHKAEVAKQFRKLFSSPPGFLNSSPSYWDVYYRGSGCFERHRNCICDCFRKSWRPPELRNEYISSFSVSKWLDLSAAEQKKHTMSNCLACANDHLSLQKGFPTLPYYIPPPVLDVSIPANSKEREVTRQVLHELAELKNPLAVWMTSEIGSKPYKGHAT